MPLDAFLLFLPACFAVNLAFGPNNLLALTNGARVGVGRTVLASGGRMIAFALMIAIAGLGLGALLATSALAFNIVKWAGAAYLVYLGVRLLKAGGPAADVEAAAPRTLAALARQEFVVAAGNPKAILVFTAFLPQFVDPGAYALSFTILGATFLVLEAVAIALYALIGARLGAAMARGRAMAWFNRISGSLMILFGVLLAFTRRPA
ncbi:LysE family translocator [Zavarzinia compransoris]|uniref:Lysine transporter LysE n=1 Tax=Zavarzinia compransoris TaxID=1264899 RepID=A0A317EF34_9PROT|nr:LysE family translocator [Zavarzinia compransoris]PWR23993.1 lysine transporter LysE [Zavarzinia compransoris]TDP48253.1 threonine/homoserine/homoserine lactone efflux protein [Zavarzinia compransoris]